jgi:hypothetical protein
MTSRCWNAQRNGVNAPMSMLVAEPDECEMTNIPGIL